MMGVDIVGELLLSDAPLLAAVPGANIMAGGLPEGVTLPAIILRSISAVDDRPLHRGATVRVAERIQVTARAKDYAQLGLVMKLIRTACADKIGDFAGATKVDVQTDVAGPDLINEGGVFERSQDFTVSYLTTR